MSKSFLSVTGAGKFVLRITLPPYSFEFKLGVNAKEEVFVELVPIAPLGPNIIATGPENFRSSSFFWSLEDIKDAWKARKISRGKHRTSFDHDVYYSCCHEEISTGSESSWLIHQKFFSKRKVDLCLYIDEFDQKGVFKLLSNPVLNNSSKTYAFWLYLFNLEQNRIRWFSTQLGTLMGVHLG